MRLEPAEKRLVESAARGELCDLLSDFETEQERTIRAAVLRDLCLQRRGWTVDPGGCSSKGRNLHGEDRPCVLRPAFRAGFYRMRVSQRD
jgi:hypothetical protein